MTEKENGSKFYELKDLLVTDLINYDLELDNNPNLEFGTDISEEGHPEFVFCLYGANFDTTFFYNDDYEAPFEMQFLLNSGSLNVSDFEDFLVNDKISEYPFTAKNAIDFVDTLTYIIGDNRRASEIVGAMLDAFEAPYIQEELELIRTSNVKQSNSDISSTKVEKKKSLDDVYSLINNLIQVYEDKIQKFDSSNDTNKRNASRHEYSSRIKDLKQAMEILEENEEPLIESEIPDISNDIKQLKHEENVVGEFTFATYDRYKDTEYPEIRYTPLHANEGDYIAIRYDDDTYAFYGYYINKDGDEYQGISSENGNIYEVFRDVLKTAHRKGFLPEYETLDLNAMIDYKDVDDMIEYVQLDGESLY